MSVSIPLKDLSDEMSKVILQYLTLIPINKREEEKKKWGRPSKFVAQGEPILMYKIDGDNILLPLRFACCIFNKIYNHDINHLKIINDGKPEFKATLRDYQIPLAMEAYENIKTYGTTILGIPPASGKTYLGIWLAYMCGLMFVVIVPREKLLEQWLLTVKMCIPDLYNYIWIPGVSDPPSNGIPAGILCMNTRVTKVPEHFRKSVGTLIIDEAHMLSTPSCVESLLYFNPRYAILETATLERNDGMHKMVTLITGEHGIFKISKKPYKIYKIEVPILVEEVMNKEGVSYIDLVKNLAANNDYNAIILDIIKSNLNRKFILLTRLTEHATNLSNWLNLSGISSDTLVGNKSTYKDSKVLVGNIGKIGTGFDEATGCEDFGGITSDVLFILPSVKEWQAFEQFRGRVMRNENPVVVWLNVKNKTIRNHFSKLQDWMKETNGTIIEKHFCAGNMILE